MSRHSLKWVLVAGICAAAWLISAPAMAHGPRGGYSGHYQGGNYGHYGHSHYGGGFGISLYASPGFYSYPNSYSPSYSFRIPSYSSQYYGYDPGYYSYPQYYSYPTYRYAYPAYGGYCW